MPTHFKVTYEENLYFNVSSWLQAKWMETLFLHAPQIFRFFGFSPKLIKSRSMEIHFKVTYKENL